jgi:outer membrane protein assembly factor BamB
MRWWIPAVILILAGTAIAYLQLTDSLEGSLKFFFSMQVSFLAVLLLWVWYLFFTGLRWRTRLVLGCLSLLGVCGLCGGLIGLLRFEGSTSGDGVPRLVWRWTPHKGEGLPELNVEAADAKRLRANFAQIRPEDYPRFLGTKGTAVVEGVRLDPDWAAHPPEQLWKKQVGLGWSSFAVVGQCAITQEQRGNQELVVCYDVPTGRVEWTHANPARFSEGLGGDGPRATPTIVDGRIYVLGATGILDCLDPATGRALWSRNVLEDAGTTNLIWGKSSSPLVFDDLVVVSGGISGPTLLAYHRDKGEPAWRGGQGMSSYQSPVLATLAGKKQVLTINATSVAAHDPTDGQVLWEYAWPGSWPKCAQPVVLDGDRVLVSAGYGAGCKMLQVRAQGTALSVSEVWANTNLRSAFANIVVRDGCAYGLDDGILACLDLASGKRKWKDGRYGHGQILLVDDLLLIQAESGDVALVEANPAAYHEVAKVPALAGKTWNNPALSGAHLLVRNDEWAACYRLPLRGGQKASGSLKPARDPVERGPEKR